MTTFRAGGASDVGQIRSNNQDSQLIADGQSVFAVADGMGGHQGGEVASAIAVETLEAVISEPTTASVVEAVKEANRRIFARAADTNELRGMGTTLVALVLVNRDGEDEEVAWVNVGDSRAYLLRDGELVQLSRDHSLVEDLRRGGQLSEEEAAVHPQRNILTRALGIDQEVEVDTDSVMPFIGDRFLLCSDGLFNEVDKATIVTTLADTEDPEAAASELVRLANDGGGRDNITCVVVDVTDDNGRSERAAAAAAAVAGAAAAATEAGEADDDETSTDAAVIEAAPLPTEEAVSPDGAPPNAVTAEMPATQGDPAVADGDLTDADPTPPRGTPLPPPPAADEDDTDAPAHPGVVSTLAAPPADGSGDGDGKGKADGEDLPFGRGTTDLYEDMDHVGGRHKAVTALVVLVLLAAVLGGAYTAGSWWSGRTYYVAAEADEVQIFRGQPGGFLIFDPTLEASPGIAADDLSGAERANVDRNPTFDSLIAAESFVNNLKVVVDRRTSAEEEPPTSTTDPGPTTTTTRPGVSSTTAPATSGGFNPTTTAAP